jgi:hypothetical protein
MSNLCCWEWGEHHSSCMVQDQPCASNRTAVGLEVIDGGAPACAMPGDTPCLVEPAPSCCVWDCSGTDLCVGASPETCCKGYCGELFCGSIYDTPDCHQAPTANGDCASSFLQSYPACCTDAGIVVPASVLSAPNEWTVSLGDPVKAPIVSDGGTATMSAAAMVPTPHTACAVGGVGAHAAHDVGIGLGAALVGVALLRRHAGRPRRADRPGGAP